MKKEIENKTIDYTTENFVRPKAPNGYLLYSMKSGKYLNQFKHLKELRQFCKSEFLQPTDVVIFRLYGDGKNNSDNMIAFLHEYAFKVKKFDKVGSLMLEREDWSWEPQKSKDYEVKIDEKRIDESVDGIAVVNFGKWNYFKFKCKFFVGGLANIFKGI
jgi:hypothetical protein